MSAMDGDVPLVADHGRRRGRRGDLAGLGGGLVGLSGRGVGRGGGGAGLAGRALGLGGVDLGLDLRRRRRGHGRRMDEIGRIDRAQRGHRGHADDGGRDHHHAPGLVLAPALAALQATEGCGRVDCRVVGLRVGTRIGLSSHGVFLPYAVFCGGLNPWSHRSVPALGRRRSTQGGGKAQITAGSERPVRDQNLIDSQSLVAGPGATPAGASVAPDGKMKLLKQVSRAAWRGWSAGRPSGRPARDVSDSGRACPCGRPPTSRARIRAGRGWSGSAGAPATAATG